MLALSASYSGSASGGITWYGAILGGTSAIACEPPVRTRGLCFALTASGGLGGAAAAGRDGRDHRLDLLAGDEYALRADAPGGEVAGPDVHPDGVLGQAGYLDGFADWD